VLLFASRSGRDERDDVGVTDQERRWIDECPRVSLVMVPDAGHFTLNEKPARIADLILEMVSADAGS
jgi:pimeloyl-ACP methyl ester carboxylesterase